MTLAAPEVSLNARCLGGHGADRPHLYLRGRGSAGEHDIASNKIQTAHTNTSDGLI